jgi:RHS repeat-associated protein
LSSVTNAQERAATLTYDADEQLSGMSMPCGCTDATATYATSNTSYSYDSDGNLQSVTTPPVEGTGGDSAPTTTYAYDALDREIRETAPGGNAGPKPYSPVVGSYQHAVTYTSYALAPGAPAVPGSGFGSPTSFNVAEQVSVTDARGDTKADAGASQCPSDVNPSDTTTPCWGQGAGDPSHTTTSDYDALGNLTEQQGPLVTDSGQSTQQHETTTYEYDQSGDQTRVVTPLGNQPFASGSGQDLHYATSSTYDPDGRVSSSVQELANGTQIETDTSYDHDGNVSEIMRPAADSAGDPEVTMYTYDGRDLPWTTTTGVTAVGQATNVTRTTVTEYDGNGNVRRTVNPAGVSQNMSAVGPADTTGQGGAYYPYEASSSDSGYDNTGNPSKTSSESADQDANIDATIRVYNTDNLLTAVYQPWGCNLTQSNNPTECTDPEAEATDPRRFRQLFARDSLGRVQTSTDSYDWTNKSAQQNQTNYTYTDSGWISSETEPTVSPTTGETTSYQYDPAGDQTSWQQSGTLSGSNGGKALGQDTTSAYYPDGQLAQNHAAGMQGVAVEHTYTYYHLPTGELDYAQTDTASTSSAPGETQNLTYDDDGRLVAVNENIPPGTVQGATPSPYDTTQAYDADGNLAQRRTNGSITPGSGLYTGGQTTSFTYDTLGRETTMAVAPNPATASTTPDSCPAPAGAQPCRFFNTTKYAPSGQVMEEQRWQGDPNNPSGQITEDYKYNDDGTLASDNRTGGDNLSVTYSYDTDANRTTDERGTHQFNALNQEVLWTRGGPDTQAPGSTVAYVHDGDGSLLQTIQNTYTKAIPITPAQPGYPNATQDESFQTTTQYCSEATAKLANTQNGSWEECQHDAGRVERINSAQTTTVTAVNNAAPGTTPPSPSTTYTTQDYCYDQLGENRRIVQAGNTTVPASSSAPMDPQNACPADPLAQGYQGENSNTTTLYGYDSFGREVSSAGPDPASQNPSSPTVVTDNYSYDALDRRYQKTESTPSQTTTTNYDYIADSDLVSQDTSLNSQAQSITDTYDYNSTGQRKGANAQAPSGGNTYHTYAVDANGSVTALENSSGGVSAGDSYHYDPYGNLELGASELQNAVSGGNFATATPENQLASDAQANKYRFEGFYYDSGVETYDMLARPYRPDTGQFLVADRFQAALGDQELAADPLTQNRYAFAGGNPTSNVEYDGHHFETDYAPGQPQCGGTTGYISCFLNGHTATWNTQGGQNTLTNQNQNTGQGTTVSNPTASQASQLLAQPAPLTVPQAAAVLANSIASPLEAVFNPTGAPWPSAQSTAASTCNWLCGAGHFAEGATNALGSAISGSATFVSNTAPCLTVGLGCANAINTVSHAVTAIVTDPALLLGGCRSLGPASSFGSCFTTIVTSLTLFKVAGAIGDAAAGTTATEDTVPLYRAVDEGEFKDAVGSQEFRAGPNSMEGKWFAEQPSDALQWGQEFYGEEPFRVLQTNVPKGYADSMFSNPNLDGIGPARYADDLGPLNSVHGGITEYTP